jgi:hypothetical protein
LQGLLPEAQTEERRVLRTHLFPFSILHYLLQQFFHFQGIDHTFLDGDQLLLVVQQKKRIIGYFLIGY